MFLRKQGFPEEGELVLCTVTAVQYNSIFAKLDEYEKAGLIHISEIAPGRIRNIRDYVSEGKKIVCKVLRTDPEKGHIDLSLRRVNESQKRAKVNEIKREQLAESILEHIARQNKLDIKQLYEKVTEVLFKQYASLFEAFEDVAQRGASLEKLGIEKAMAAQLTDVISARIKPPEVVIKGELSLTSYAPNGVELMKEALKKA